MTGVHGRAGRPRPGELAERSERILDIAEQLLAGLGYHGVSLARIAREAHVAVRTIYRQHGGKPDIVKALIDRQARRHVAELGQIASTACPRARLVQLAQFISHLVRSERRWNMYRCVLALGDMRAMQTFYESDAGQLLSMLEIQFTDPELRRLCGSHWPPRVLCDLFLGHVIGNNLRRLLMPLPIMDGSTHLTVHTEATVLSFFSVLHSASSPAFFHHCMEVE